VSPSDVDLADGIDFGAALHSLTSRDLNVLIWRDTKKIEIICQGLGVTLGFIHLTLYIPTTQSALVGNEWRSPEFGCKAVIFGVDFTGPQI